MANVDAIGIITYIYIDYMGYMTNPIDLCWFMKLITHLAINWGCFFFGEMCM
jgi:hypothetical protein